MVKLVTVDGWLVDQARGHGFGDIGALSNETEVSFFFPGVVKLVYVDWCLVYLDTYFFSGRFWTKVFWTKVL